MIIAEPIQIAAPEVKAPEVESPYNRAMAIWASWIKLSDQQESTGNGHPQDTKDFMRTGEAVEVMINDLPRLHWWAIRKSKGIATVWRYPDRSLPDALAEAEEILTVKMRNNLATRRFFN